MAKTMSAEWMSTLQAATYLGVATPTLYRLIDAGDLTGYRMGRLIRLRRRDVEAFLEGARIKSTGKMRESAS